MIVISTDSNIEFADLGVPLYRKRKACYGFERSQRSTIAKRRKFFDHVSGVTSDGGFSSESVSNSPMKGVDGDKPCSSAKLLVPQDSHGNSFPYVHSFCLSLLFITLNSNLCAVCNL